MKTFNMIFLGGMLSLFATNDLCPGIAFERGKTEIAVATEKQQPATGTDDTNPYVVTLESRTLVNGNWEWVWSVYNANPGSGNNGTAQDLSNWGMRLASCVDWSTVVGAAYSSNGLSWTEFTPVYQTDPSQNCLTTPVLKFDFGTSGANKSYYRLTVSQDYSEGPAGAYYKSGVKTGCFTFDFTGINDCGGPVEIVE
jgi:hypothetical protein